MLSAGINMVGFSWITSPAATELEMIVLDWLAKLLKLHDDFLSTGWLLSMSKLNEFKRYDSLSNFMILGLELDCFTMKFLSGDVGKIEGF
ncbi:putative tyrosine decarboxylase 2 [Camellia lanceoleosa]|uniref:Tyrosine decarboxylase 2 n=1 Tax=Camellia lanceoleosa TaxID=1840588 RepID=A0ACC0GM33_9ERIC|nr:putative tyrosine decarboxylase 2 [Camellia lanceoleosa]